ncbi:MAG TPA: polymer-forming cytoskeletal protein [Bryobacteraceae bacterium]|nr:polymer-forming cytoskeletal protein [Bryobacteraceae bacterium]
MANITNEQANIGKAVTIKGEVFSKEDLYVDGALEGRIELPAHKLTVGPNGSIKTGVIQAGSVVILGNVQGDVNAQDKVEIRKDATLTGNIKTARIIIEEGAYFKGGVDIATKPPA